MPRGDPTTAFHAFVFACDDPRRACQNGSRRRRDIGSRVSKFEFGRHGDPKLKALDPLRANIRRYARPPLAGAHPLDTAGLDDASRRWSPC